MAEYKHPVKDFRINTYRITKRVLFIAIILLMIKVCFFDSSLILSSQMAPTIIPGDRVLVWRLPFHPIFRSVLSLGRSQPVIYKDIAQASKRGCLRVRGLSSDTISIDNGIFYNHSSDDTITMSHKEIVPADFSPRDNFEAYRIPSPGDTIKIDSLSPRDFFFALSILKQENPENRYTIKPIVYQGDSLLTTVTIKDFSLYKGNLDSIPEHLKIDWFFWDRLREYLSYRYNDKRFYILFSLIENGNRKESFVVTSNYLFLLADNWSEGFDSRYFGPIKRTNITGVITGILWSHGDNSRLPGKLRPSRIGKLIR